MVSLLLEFPSDALNNILYFLPQDLLLNLALTNFHFYEPCLKRLYQRLVIQTDPALRSASTVPAHYRRDDFVESSATVIAGLSDIERPRQAHLKMVEARVRTLITSIQVNPQLAQYIELVEIEGIFRNSVENAIFELLQLLSTLANEIAKIYISDLGLRKRLGWIEMSRLFPSLTTICVDSVLEIADLKDFPKLNEIVVADVEKDPSMNASHVHVLTKIEHLIVSSEADVSNRFSMLFGCSTSNSHLC